jgi:hypothetical protein
MLVEQPVGDATTELVELDALDDLAAVGGPDRVLAGVDVVGLEHLELHRDRETAVERPQSPHDQHLAGLDDRPHHELLEAVHREAAGGVALVVSAQRSHSSPIFSAFRPVRLRFDSPSDRIRHDSAQSATRPRVVSHQITCLSHAISLASRQLLRGSRRCSFATSRRFGDRPTRPRSGAPCTRAMTRDRPQLGEIHKMKRSIQFIGPCTSMPADTTRCRSPRAPCRR